MKFCPAHKTICVAAMVLTIVGLVFGLWLYLRSFRQVKDIVLVQIKDLAIKAEIALLPQDHYQGLSGRDNLCSDCGLLFVFPDKQIRSFIMRDMNFPLDIIFIEEGVIKNISASASQNDSTTIYFSQGSADQVLEINAGLSASYGLAPGDQVNIKNYEN